MMKKLEFKPRLLPTLLTLVLLPLLVSLGVWQYQRSLEKQALRQVRQQNANKEAFVLLPTQVEYKDELGHQVIAQGHFDTRHQVLLEHQKYKAQPGYHVFTPFQIQGSQTYVLVNRGWVAHRGDRHLLPDVTLSAAPNRIDGRIDSVPSVGIKLGQPNEEIGDWPMPVTYISIPWLENILQYKFLPYIVKQTSDDGSGLIRDWDESQFGYDRMPPEKHMSYAVQWFSLAATLLLIFLFLNIRVRKS